MQVRALITAAGGAGTSTGTAITETLVRGYLEAVSIVFAGGNAATTTVTITENDNNGVSRTILAQPAGNTTVTLYPRTPAVNLVGAAIANSAAQVWFPGYSLTIAVAAANNNDKVTVIISTSPGNREY